MHNLDWLIGLRFKGLTRREYDWTFLFDDKTYLVAACLWRLVEAGRIRFTSQDDGQKFGLTAPVDVSAEVNSRLVGSIVESVHLRAGTLDLSITFSSGHILEVIPESSGYEAWDVGGQDQRLIAVGGGELTIFKDGLEKG